MSFKSSTSCRAILLLAVLSFSVQPLLAAQKKHHRKPTPAKQETPPPAPQPPPPPTELTLAQKPAVPPQVTYEKGQLTIVAENSTIGDVLRAVRNKTGATVDMPPNATQRIVIRVGPGPARDVLASLLNGSDFNYVLLGAAGDPGAVQKIIVSPKPAGSDAVQASALPANAVPPQVYGGGPPQTTETADDTENDSETDNGNQEAEQPEPPAGQGQPAAQPGIKTPEQLLQELQQQQQMLQQQQQQQQQGQPGPQN